MRPIGGLTMGYIGDKYGRKRALVLSIFLMAFPTFTMGCLPSYEKAGGLSIVLLVIVRLLQGFSVGGQVRSVVDLSGFCWLDRKLIDATSPAHVLRSLYSREPRTKALGLLWIIGHGRS